MPEPTITIVLSGGPHDGQHVVCGKDDLVEVKRKAAFLLTNVSYPRSPKTLERTGGYYLNALSLRLSDQTHTATWQAY